MHTMADLEKQMETDEGIDLPTLVVPFLIDQATTQEIDSNVIESESLGKRVMVSLTMLETSGKKQQTLKAYMVTMVAGDRLETDMVDKVREDLINSGIPEEALDGAIEKAREAGVIPHEVQTYGTMNVLYRSFRKAVTAYCEMNQMHTQLMEEAEDGDGDFDIDFEKLKRDIKNQENMNN